MRSLPLYTKVEPSVVFTPPALDLGNGSCSVCPFCTGAKKQKCVSAEGDPGGLLVVGESPTRTEEATARPFTGESGRLVRDIVARSWDRMVAYDLALRCFVPPTYKGKSGVSQFLAMCRGYLRGSIEEVKPTRVVAVGIAWEALFGRSVDSFSLRKPWALLHGAPWMPEGIPVFGVLSLSHVYNPHLKRWFVEGLTHSLTAPSPITPTHGRVYLVESEDASAAVCTRMRAWPNGSVVVDVETSGCLYSASFGVEAIGIARVGDDSNTAYVWRGDAVYSPALRAVLEDACVVKVAHNGKYDTQALSWGLKCNARGFTQDTRLMWKLLQAHAPGDLATLADLVGLGGHKEAMEEEKGRAAQPVRELLKMEAVYERRGKGPRPPTLSEVGVPARLHQFVRDSARNVDSWVYSIADQTVISQYVARDAVTTARLKGYLDTQLSGTPMEETHVRLVSAASEAIAYVERWGILVDKSRVYAFDAYIGLKLSNIQSQLHGLSPTTDWNSTLQVRELLYVKLGLQAPYRKTPTGMDSTDEEALTWLAEKYPNQPVPQLLLEHRKWSKLRSTYALSLLEFVRDDRRIHPSFLLDGTASGRASCRDPNCFSGDTEILTPTGWVRFDSLTPEDRVAQWSESRGIQFVHPQATQVVEFDGSLVHMKNQHIDLLVTPDHRCLTRNRKTGRLVVHAARKYPRDAQQLNAGLYLDGTVSVDDAFVRLLVATQADGSWHDSGIVFGFTKRRKAMRLAQIFCALKAPHSFARSRDGNYRFRLLAGPLVEKVRAYIGDQKVFGWWVLQWTPRALHVFAEELWYWDGCITHTNDYVSKHRVNADVVQTVLSLIGKRAHLRPYVWAGHTYWRVDVVHRDYALTANVKRKAVPFRGLVYCVSVPSTYVVIRRGAAVMITGQCQQIPRATSPEGKMARDIFVASEGCKLVQFDYSALEMKVAAILSGDKVMAEIFRSGVDFHMRTAQLIAKAAWNIDPSAVTKEHRTAAKVTGFGALYGKTDATLAKDLHISKDEAASVRAALFGSFKKLAEWCREVTQATRQTGESWTLWDGKPARRRSLHDIGGSGGRQISAENAAINTPVQGSGSDYLLASLTACVQWILEEKIPAKLVLPVHDSLLFDVREDAVEELLYVAPRIMCGWPSGDVPLTVDAEVGDSWGSMVKVAIK